MARNKSDVMINVGRWIHLERERRNLTMRDVEERSGISASTISRIENGYDAEFITVAKVCNALDLPIDMVMGAPLNLCPTCGGSGLVKGK